MQKSYVFFHDLMQKVTSLDDVTVVSVKGNDYRINFLCMSKKRHRFHEKAWFQLWLILCITKKMS